MKERKIHICRSYSGGSDLSSADADFFGKRAGFFQQFSFCACFPALLSGSPQVALERSEEHLVLSHVTCAGDSMLSGQPAGSFGLCLADGLAYVGGHAISAFIFMLLTDGLWGILEDAGSYGKQEQEAAGIKRETLYIFLFFLLVWGIVLLAVYPGFFVYDAQDEFNQVAMRRFTTHHPLLHVVLLGGIVSLGNKIFASYNAGIALYMVFRCC